jgi:hypothetical protein
VVPKITILAIPFPIGSIGCTSLRLANLLSINADSASYSGADGCFWQAALAISIIRSTQIARVLPSICIT